jgi:hypothetical protein
MMPNRTNPKRNIEHFAFRAGPILSPDSDCVAGIRSRMYILPTNIDFTGALKWTRVRPSLIKCTTEWALTDEERGSLLHMILVMLACDVSGFGYSVLL